MACSTSVLDSGRAARRTTGNAPGSPAWYRLRRRYARPVTNMARPPTAGPHGRAVCTPPRHCIWLISVAGPSNRRLRPAGRLLSRRGSPPFRILSPASRLWWRPWPAVGLQQVARAGLDRGGRKSPCVETTPGSVLPAAMQQTSDCPEAMPRIEGHRTAEPARTGGTRRSVIDAGA